MLRTDVLPFYVLRVCVLFCFVESRAFYAAILECLNTLTSDPCRRHAHRCFDWTMTILCRRTCSGCADDLPPMEDGSEHPRRVRRQAPKPTAGTHTIYPKTTDVIKEETEGHVITTQPPTTSSTSTTDVTHLVAIAGSGLAALAVVIVVVIIVIRFRFKRGRRTYDDPLPHQQWENHPYHELGSGARGSQAPSREGSSRVYEEVQRPVTAGSISDRPPQDLPPTTRPSNSAGYSSPVTSPLELSDSQWDGYFRMRSPTREPLEDIDSYVDMRGVDEVQSSQESANYVNTVVGPIQ